MKVDSEGTFLLKDMHNNFVDKKLAITAVVVLTINDIIVVHQPLSGSHKIVLKDLTKLM